MSNRDLPELDRSAFSVISLEHSGDDADYWRGKTPAERLAAVELSRRMVYGYARTTSRLQRVLEIAELE